MFSCCRCKCRNYDCCGEHIYNVVARHARFKTFERFLTQARKENHPNQNDYLQNAISYAKKNPDYRVLDYLLNYLLYHVLCEVVDSQNLKEVAYYFDFKHELNSDILSELNYYLNKVLRNGIEQENIDDKVLKMFIDEELFYNENVYIYAARYSPKETIILLFDELRGFLGEDNFPQQLNESRSNNGEDVLTILTAREDLTSEDSENIYTKYNMYPAHYSSQTGRSAVILAIQKQRWDFAVLLINKINTRECNDNEKKGFRKAMGKLETKLYEIPLKEEKKRESWGRALTWRAGNIDQKGRESKLYPYGFRRDRRTFSKKKKKGEFDAYVTLLQLYSITGNIILNARSTGDANDRGIT